MILLSKSLKDEYQLIEGMLEKGFPYIAAKLEKMINQPVIITDCIGKIYYPDLLVSNHSIDDLFIELPSEIYIENYFYNKKNLYFNIDHNSLCLYIIVKGLSEPRVPWVVSVFNQIRPVIEIYLTINDQILKKTNEYESYLGKHLFFTSNANIRDLLKLSERDLDLNKPYFVSIVEVDQSYDEIINWDLIRSYSAEYLKKHNLDVIPIAWPNCLISIVPARFKKDTFEIDPEWPRLIDSINWKEVIDKKFNIITSNGLGQVYTLLDLHKSYNEARIALTLPRLMGKKGFVQQFSELGVFTLIFSQDIEKVKHFCNKSLGRLIETDEKEDSGLLSSLRKLLDNNFNWKSTADSMFMHVNTLHYRIEKIEELLEVDLSKMEDRTDLYTAIKAWDTLRLIGYWE